MVVQGMIRAFLCDRALVAHRAGEHSLRAEDPVPRWHDARDVRAAGFFGEIGLSGAESESELDALPRGVCAESLPASADRAGPARSHKPPDAKRGEGSPAAR